MPKVSVLIPTLNEEEGLRSVLTQVPPNYAVIVVDGVSSDGTLSVARKYGARIIIESRCGYGRAFKTGFSKASSDIIATLDGDGTYPVEKLEELINHFVEHELDFLTTDRFASMECGAMSLKNRIGNFILTAAANFLFGIKLKDSQSGMFIFKKSILPEISPHEDGMAFSQEIKVLAFTSSLRTAELPIRYRKRLGTTKLVGFRDGVSNLMALFKLKSRLLLSNNRNNRAISSNKFVRPENPLTVPAAEA